MLQDQCMDMKKSANSLAEENTKARTRLRVVERELQRRDRLLRQLAAMKKAGQGIDSDVIEKLREERNMFPMVRKKAQELQQQVEEKDKEIKQLKRDPQFTRIIELQVEYATWQHEVQRLRGLMQDPSVEANPVAQQEIEVHEARVYKLKSELEAATEKAKKVASDLRLMQGEHDFATTEYREEERKLQEEQEATRKLAMDYKKELQERRRVEQMETEIEQKSLAIKQMEEEIAELQAAASVGDTPRKDAEPVLSRFSVSKAAQSSLIPDGNSRAAFLLGVLRRTTNLREPGSSLFKELLQRDTDTDGLLSREELAKSLQALGVAVSEEDLTILSGLAPADALLTPGSHVRWLDLLLAVDRSAPSRVPVPPSLPDIRPLRAACLASPSAPLSAEDLKRGLMAKRHELEEFFLKRLGLDIQVAASWMDAWDAHGPDRLLLRMPIGDIAIGKEDFDAWFTRCRDAIIRHRKESKLDEALQTWNKDMSLTQEEFTMVCTDTLDLDLSPDDISDLLLFISGGREGPVDGSKLLKIARAA